MNRFILSPLPEIAAMMHCDKHVVKMILEEAQMLSTAHRVIDGTMYIEERHVPGSPSKVRRIKRWKHPDKDMDTILYQATHINHPCAEWSRVCHDNYMWGYELLDNLCEEYTYRYGKVHSVQSSGLMDALSKAPHNTQWGRPLTEFPQAMPDHCKHRDAVEAYRQYYIKEKVRFAKWTRREVPYWWPNV